MNETIKPDIIADIHLNSTEMGGRRSPIGGPEAIEYPTLFILNNEAWDCRLFTNGKTLALGQSHTIPIRFLSWHLVSPLLTVGKAFTLLELGEFATGVILEVVREKSTGKAK